ncbi:hypothetical protein V8F20_006935 [Naviculisporaceae sp. PSN 640]
MDNNTVDPPVLGGPAFCSVQEDYLPTATVTKIESVLRSVSKFKERSYETSKANHLPVLNSLPSVVLLGDSMLERMLTTGLSSHASPPPCLGEWPPPNLMTDSELETALAPMTLGKTPCSRLPNVLNLGVGGDRIQNIVYRMIGDSQSSEKPLEGYTPYLVQLRSIKLWVIQAGTNNLHPKHGLRDIDLSALEQLLRALLLVPSNENGEASSRVLLTGLFKRSDISHEQIDAANGKLEALVENLNGSLRPEKGGDRVVYMPPVAGIGYNEEFFVDHVHLNLLGYQEWMKELVPMVYRCVAEGDEG